MAEAVLTSKLSAAGLDDSVQVESAGTGSWHVGDPADPRALTTLREHGYSGDSHRARQFTAEWFDRFDLVLAMDTDNLSALRQLAVRATDRDKVKLLRSYEPEAGVGADMDVPDPYYGGIDGFDHVLAMVERAADGLVDALKEDQGDN